RRLRPPARRPADTLAPRPPESWPRCPLDYRKTLVPRIAQAGNVRITDALASVLAITRAFFSFDPCRDAGQGLSPMNRSLTSRRKFLVSSAAGVSGAWLTANWPGIAAAADHAAHMASAPGFVPTKFVFFTAEEAADVDAIAAQLLPSGATPGARDAHAVYFIDQ